MAPRKFAVAEPKLSQIESLEIIILYHIFQNRQFDSTGVLARPSSKFASEYLKFTVCDVGGLVFTKINYQELLPMAMAKYIWQQKS